MIRHMNVVYGETDLPRGYQYVYMAETTDKADCNDGHGGKAAYIITKKKTISIHDDLPLDMGFGEEENE